MISSKHIRELLDFRTPSEATVSLYLELEPLQSYRRVLQGLMADLQNSREVTPDLYADLRKIEQFVNLEFKPEEFRGLCVFSSKRFGLWRVCPLPQPARNALVVDSKPYLAPLTSLTDQYHRFGVVLVNAEITRFMEVYMGQIKEYEEFAIRPNIPPAAGQDSVGDEAGNWHSYFKCITEKLEALARSQEFDRLVLGVSPDLALLLVNHLHSKLQRNLILDPDLDPTMPHEEVLGRITACENQARKVRENVLVQRLIDASTAGKMGVLGLEKTLEALQKGQVRLLLIRDGFAKLGRRCLDCQRLSLNDHKCNECGRPTQAVFNLINEMIQKAFELNCEVFRVFHETQLDNLGRIGAQLSTDANPKPTALAQPH